jgi:hypothetical protein
MIAHKSPRITTGLGFGNNLATPLKKIFPVRSVFKDRFAFDSPDDDVMQRTRGIYAGFTRQDIYVSDRTHYVIYN